jgi:hypothetical protein
MTQFDEPIKLDAIVATYPYAIFYWSEGVPKLPTIV